MKNKVIVSKGMSDENTWALEMANGREITIDVRALSEGIIAKLIEHGLGQKVGDAASALGGDLDAAFDAMSDVAQALVDGDWNRRKASGEGSVTDLIQAIVDITGKDMAAVKAKIEAADKETKAKIRKEPRIAARLAEIRLERLQAKVGDSDTVTDLEDLF